MGRKKIQTANNPKRKRVKTTRIERTDDGGPEPYAILDRLVASSRRDLADVKIALAWRREWTVDPDGRLTVGKCCKPREASRPFMEYDIVILLNEELWPLLAPLQKKELLFHEITHIVVVLDRALQPQLDERSRPVLRIRKHDIEEFAIVRERYGPENLGSVAASILARSKEPLLQAHAETPARMSTVAP